MRSEIPDFLLNGSKFDRVKSSAGSSNIHILDKGLDQIVWLIDTIYLHGEMASREGLFQGLDARVKVFFLLFFVIIVSLKKTLLPEVLIGCFVFFLVSLSRIDFFRFYRRVISFGFMFGFLIALPSSLNIFAGGDVLIPFVRLTRSYVFWIYHIPDSIGITGKGIWMVAMFTVRVINSLSISFLVICTTPFPDIIKALKSLKVPDLFLMVMTIAYRYILIFTKTLEDIHLAKKSKTVKVDTRETGIWIAGRMAFLFRKTKIRCDELFDAMLARGFTGDIRIYHHRKITDRDIMTGSFLFIIGLIFLWI